MSHYNPLLRLTPSHSLVKKMMHVVAFRGWAKDPANFPPYGLTPEESKIEFERRASDPDTLTDEKGPDQFSKRIGVVVEDLAIDREALIKEQGYELLDSSCCCLIRLDRPSPLL